MGGIINYYHGEFGDVVNHRVIDSGGQRVRVIRLRRNPHREFAFDYLGSDVHIDPRLKSGDRAVFIRLEPYGGLWVREEERLYPELQKARNRVEEDIRKNSTPDIYMIRVQGIWSEEFVSSETQNLAGVPLSNRPATKTSLFLSFSSRNIMLARQIFEDLKYDAKVDVWFDLDQAGEAPEHRRRIESWLREAIYGSLGFVLLWTKAASQSSWVRREIAWVSEKSLDDPNFHFIILKLDGEPIPEDLSHVPYIVECQDLWPVNGINEELFAAVHRRRGRVAWLEEHKQRGVEFFEKNQDSNDYEPFQSDSGVAISLSFQEEDGICYWGLKYEKEGKSHKSSGCGRDEAIDLDIRPGDEVGFYILHRAPLVRFWPGKTLWMRSGDLSIRPEDVWEKYTQKCGGDQSSLQPTTPDISDPDAIQRRMRVVSVVDGDTILMRFDTASDALS